MHSGKTILLIGANPSGFAGNYMRILDSYNQHIDDAQIGKIPVDFVDALMPAESKLGKVILSRTAKADIDNIVGRFKNIPAEYVQIKDPIDLERLIARTQIHGACIVTPDTTHKEYVEVCLCRDVNVLCEKPLTSDVHDYLQLANQVGDKYLDVELPRLVDLPVITQILNDHVFSTKSTKLVIHITMHSPLSDKPDITHNLIPHAILPIIGYQPVPTKLANEKFVPGQYKARGKNIYVQSGHDKSATIECALSGNTGYKAIIDLKYTLEGEPRCFDIIAGAVRISLGFNTVQPGFGYNTIKFELNGIPQIGVHEDGFGEIYHKNPNPLLTQYIHPLIQGTGPTTPMGIIRSMQVFLFSTDAHKN